MAADRANYPRMLDLQFSSLSGLLQQWEGSVSFLACQAMTQSSLRFRLYMVLSTTFSIFFQSLRL
jgi:hypothetical protein